MNIGTEVKIVGLNTVQVALERADAPRGVISHAGIRLVSNLAAAGRGVLMDTFTNSSGPSSLHYNNMYWRRMMGKGPLAENAAGYYDRRGPKHRLIHYSLKSRFGVKTARKWIMTVKLAPLVAAKGPKYAEEAERMIESEMTRLMNGGN